MGVLIPARAVIFSHSNLALLATWLKNCTTENITKNKWVWLIKFDIVIIVVKLVLTLLRALPRLRPSSPRDPFDVKAKAQQNGWAARNAG